MRAANNKKTGRVVTDYKGATALGRCVQMICEHARRYSVMNEREHATNTATATTQKVCTPIMPALFMGEQ